MATIRQSQPYVILIFILGIFMIGFTFLVLLKPMQIVYDETHATDAAVMDLTALNTPELCRKEGHVWDSGGNECVSDFQLFYVRTRTFILWLPFILIFPLIIWTLIKANEKQQSY
jgi:hypothetical protein